MDTQPDTQNDAKPKRSNPGLFALKLILFLAFGINLSLMGIMHIGLAFSEVGSLAAIGRDETWSAIAGCSGLAGLLCWPILLYLLLFRTKVSPSSAKALRGARRSWPSRIWRAPAMVLLVICVGSAGTFTTALVVNARLPKYALTYTLRPARDVVTVGEPVLIDFTLTNELDRTVSVRTERTPFGNRSMYPLRVRRDGRYIPHRDLQDEDTTDSIEESIELAAGEHHTIRVDVSRWFDLTEPGEYELRFEGLIHYRFVPTEEPGKTRRAPLPLCVVTLRVEAGE